MSATFHGKPSPRFLELSAEEWFVLLLGSTTLVALLAAVRTDVTMWPAAGLLFTAVVFGHLCMTTPRFVAFPDLIASAACLQWIVAPWLAESYPPTLSLFRMALAPADYLRYAVPATMALWVGLNLPVTRRTSRTWSMPDVGYLPRRARYVLDAAIVIGLAIDGYASLAGARFAFLLFLIGWLRFAAALGWMVTQTPGWPLRVAVVLLHLAATQSSTGAFYLVIHWGGYFLLVFAFMRRWRWQVAVVLTAGMLALAVLQDVKPTLRQALVQEEVTGPVESLNTVASLMWSRISEGRLTAPETQPGDLLVRFNQGWIIARVMTHVPREEPFARGRTVADAAIYSVLPRFLFPEKREGASQELFTRYSGVELPRSTRMGLGIIGELYANFGAAGGVLATFVYGLLMGTLFLWFADRAQKNRVWWAAAPMVLLPGIEPGFNLEDIVNHVVKAAVMFFVLWQAVPPLKHVLQIPERAPSDEDEQASDLPLQDDAIFQPGAGR